MTGAPGPATDRRERSWPIRRLLAGVAGVSVVVIALAVFASVPRGACGCSQTAPPLPPSPVEGVVLAVQSTGLNDIQGFTLRLADGSSVELRLGILENATDFSPSHLAEHQLTGVPVRASYRLLNDVPTVYRLEDAEG